jgi:hypothetical protein
MAEQFSLPPRVVNGRFATVPQGTDTELADRVNVLCRTPPDWLDGRPGFGLADQRFRKTGADTTVVSSQIDTWVPDAKRLVDHDPSLLDRGLDYLGIRVAAR